MLLFKNIGPADLFWYQAHRLIFEPEALNQPDSGQRRISPTLYNMTMDGIQSMLEGKYHPKLINRKSYYPKVHVIRYADDFIITGRSRGLLELEIMPLIKEYLAERGLTLSDEKTKITHINDGFDFLGFNLRKYDRKLLIKPSKEKVKKFLVKIRETIDVNKACTQEVLILLLNPMITGRANYYKHCVAARAFFKTDHQIFCKLWQWSKRRHPKKETKRVKQKYFQKIGNMDWRFSVDYYHKGNKGTVTLKRLSDTKITRHVQTLGKANPYDPKWNDYFEKRETHKMLISPKGRQSLLNL